MGLMDNFDNVADKAKDLASEHSDKVNEGVDKAAEFIGDKTGGKFGDQIDMGADKLKEQLGTDQQ